MTVGAKSGPEKQAMRWVISGHQAPHQPRQGNTGPALAQGAGPVVKNALEK